MTITILTPTFNDDAHLPRLINSVCSQDHTDWQWIIINDGSTDNTYSLLNELTDSRIKIIHQSNADQLNALRAAAPFIKGEIICMMHSDDCFVSNSTLRETTESLRNSGCEGVYADYKLIDKNGVHAGILRTPEQVNTDTVHQIILGMGSNPIGDPFFVSRKAFFSHVLPNYIENNTIYFLNSHHSPPLKLKKANPWYCYRVFNENYIHSDIGKFVAISGQFRTTSRILATTLNISGNTAWGYYFFRILRKKSIELPNFFRSSSNLGAYRYFKFWAKDLERYRYPEILQDMALAIGRSFKTRENNQQKCLIVTPPLESAYRPADARQFYKDHIRGVVPNIYYQLIRSDYDYLQVKTHEEYIKLQQILNFLSLQHPIKISEL